MNVKKKKREREEKFLFNKIFQLINKKNTRRTKRKEQNTNVCVRIINEDDDDECIY